MVPTTWEYLVVNPLLFLAGNPESHVPDVGNVFCPFLLLCAAKLCCLHCVLSNREHTSNVLNVMFVVTPFPHLRIQELLLEGGDVNKLRTRHQNMIIFFFSLSKNPVTSKQVYTF